MTDRAESREWVDEKLDEHLAPITTQVGEVSRAVTRIEATLDEHKRSVDSRLDTLTDTVIVQAEKLGAVQAEAKGGSKLLQSKHVTMGLWLVGGVLVVAAGWLGLDVSEIITNLAKGGK